MTFKLHHLKRAIKKASQSQCHHKVSAIGFDKNGKVLGSTFNRCRFSRYQGGEHAEALLIRRYRSHLKTILICRVNKNGGLLPIEPCNACSNLARKMGIQIKTIM